MNEQEQPGYDPRLEWAAEGAALLARAGAVVLAGCLRNASAVAAAARRLAVAAFLEAADLLAAEHDVSRVVPRLAGGAFAQVSWPG